MVLKAVAKFNNLNLVGKCYCQEYEKQQAKQPLNIHPFLCYDL
jgi:hypothetical protein